MDRKRFEEHLGNIRRGDPDRADRFETTVTILAADPKIAGMPQEAQNKILDKVAKRYKQKGRVTKEEITAEKGVVDISGADEVKEISSDIEGVTGEGLSPEGQKALMEGLKGYGKKGLMTAGLGAAIADVPFGQALKGAMVSPEAIAAGAAGITGDVLAAELGYTEEYGLLGKGTELALKLAIGAALPEFALVASLAGKPITDAIMDFTDQRKYETPLDMLEDRIGKTKAMQVVSKYREDIRDIPDAESWSQMEEQRLEEYSKAIAGTGWEQKLADIRKGFTPEQRELRALEGLVMEAEQIPTRDVPKITPTKVKEYGKGVDEIAAREQIKTPDVPEIKAPKEKKKRRRGGLWGGPGGRDDDRGDTFGGFGRAAGGEWGGPSGFGGGHDVGEVGLA